MSYRGREVRDLLERLEGRLSRAVLRGLGGSNALPATRQQALEDYTRAVELDPSNAYAYAGRGMTHLQMKNSVLAQADLSLACERDSRNIRTRWLAEWAGLGRQRAGGELADRLETIAAIDAQQYHAYVCRAVALGLRGNLKEGLEEVEQAITFLPEEWDAYFWKGKLGIIWNKLVCALSSSGNKRDMSSLHGKRLQPLWRPMPTTRQTAGRSAGMHPITFSMHSVAPRMFSTMIDELYCFRNRMIC